MLKITSDLSRAFRVNRDVATNVTTSVPGAWIVTADGGDTLLASGVSTNFSVNQIFVGGDAIELTGDVSALNKAPLLNGRYTAVTDQFVTLNNATPQIGDSLFIANQQDLIDLSTNTGKVLVARSIKDRGWKVGEVIKVHSTYKVKGETFTNVIEYVRTATQLMDPFNVYSLNLDGVNDQWYTELSTNSLIKDIKGCSGLTDNYTQNSGLTLSAWFKTSDILADVTPMFGLTTATGTTDANYMYVGVAATGFNNDVEGLYAPLGWIRTSNLGAAGTNLSYNVTGLDSSGAAKPFSTTLGLCDGEWHHIAASYTGSGMYLYVDNYVDDSYFGAASGMFERSGNPLSYVAIGKSHGPTASGLTEFFEGNVNELSVWNRALTTNEVSEIYNSGEPGNLATVTFATGLVGWWRCGDGDQGGKGVSGMTPASGVMSDMLYKAGTWPVGSGTDFIIPGLYTGMFEKG